MVYIRQKTKNSKGGDRKKVRDGLNLKNYTVLASEPEKVEKVSETLDKTGMYMMKTESKPEYIQEVGLYSVEYALRPVKESEHIFVDAHKTVNALLDAQAMSPEKKRKRLIKKHYKREWRKATGRP